MKKVLELQFSLWKSCNFKTYPILFGNKSNLDLDAISTQPMDVMFYHSWNYGKCDLLPYSLEHDVWIYSPNNVS
jgi:hypothetical protein